MTQKFQFAQCTNLEISKYFPTWASHNLLNFYLMILILYFSESLICLLQSIFCSILHLKMLSWCKMSLKKWLLLTFWKWPVMYELISFKWCFSWSWGKNRSCRECDYLQNELLLGKIDEVCESYPGQSSVDFSYRNPNLAILDFW